MWKNEFQILVNRQCKTSIAERRETTAPAYLLESFQAATQGEGRGSQNLAIWLGIHVEGLGCFPSIGLISCLLYDLLKESFFFCLDSFWFKKTKQKPLVSFFIDCESHLINLNLC